MGMDERVREWEREREREREYVCVMYRLQTSTGNTQADEGGKLKERATSVPIEM